MAVWETPDVLPHPTAAVLEFAPIWQAAEKIVYSTTLQTVSDEGATVHLCSGVPASKAVHLTGPASERSR